MTLTFDFGWVPDAILMSSQTRRAFFQFTEVKVEELSEL